MQWGQVHSFHRQTTLGIPLTVDATGYFDKIPTEGMQWHQNRKWPISQPVTESFLWPGRTFTGSSVGEEEWWRDIAMYMLLLWHVLWPRARQFTTHTHTHTAKTILPLLLNISSLLCVAFATFNISTYPKVYICIVFHRVIVFTSFKAGCLGTFRYVGYSQSPTVLTDEGFCLCRVWKGTASHPSSGDSVCRCRYEERGIEDAGGGGRLDCLFLGFFSFF